MSLAEEEINHNPLDLDRKQTEFEKQKYEIIKLRASMISLMKEQHATLAFTTPKRPTTTRLTPSATPLILEPTETAETEQSEPEPSAREIQLQRQLEELLEENKLLKSETDVHKIALTQERQKSAEREAALIRQQRELEQQYARSEKRCKALEKDLGDSRQKCAALEIKLAMITKDLEKSRLEQSNLQEQLRAQAALRLPPSQNSSASVNPYKDVSPLRHARQNSVTFISGILDQVLPSRAGASAPSQAHHKRTSSSISQPDFVVGEDEAVQVQASSKLLAQVPPSISQPSVASLSSVAAASASSHVLCVDTTA
eukprot:TRINITY_DN4968_c0_g1_i7.p1 TRINITY_DN4968_c0_g1~~TRINITY_DN4968_c0_g1_i7.p1  ORF type:complete len:351 (+),score=55.64 TRINITY_DN4968_c0_g1_i7:112-1053(+)